MHIKTSQPLPELLTIPAAARALGRDARTVRRWLESPEAKGVTVVFGKRSYIRREALLDLIGGATPTSDGENDR